MAKQKKMHTYMKMDYSEDIINEITDNDYEGVINEDIENVEAKTPEDFPEKYDKLGDPLYSVFGYPSKVYYKTISRFIESYSNKDDTVLDPMAGSGATAIASLYKQRKVIVNDGSKLSYFILKNTTLPIKPTTIMQAVDNIEDKIRTSLKELYSVPCKYCDSMGEINYIMQSDIYECPECENEFPIYGNESEKKSTYKCPKCSTKIRTNINENKKHRVMRRKPVEVNYKCDNPKCKKTNYKIKVNKDLEIFWDKILKKYEHFLDELFLPNDNLITDRWYTRKNGWPGINKGAEFKEFFTKRNLIALSLINNQIEEIENNDIKNQLKFVFLSGLIRCSNRMYKTSVVKTYYQVPSIGKVQNAWFVFERKLKTLIKSKREIRKFPNLTNLDYYKKRIKVMNKDAKKLDLPNNSVDYIFIDPPYGSQIGYYELNSFFTSWMDGIKENLEDEVIIPMETDQEEEYVKKWGKSMEQVFRECIRVLKPNRYITIMFHHNSDKIWNEFKTIFDKLDAQFIEFTDLKRGTTFHTNRLSDNSPKSAFVTYIKEINKNPSNTNGKEEIIKRKLENKFDDISKKSFRDIQSEVIKIVYENNIEKVPSEEYIKNIIKEIKKNHQVK